VVSHLLLAFVNLQQMNLKSENLENQNVMMTEEVVWIFDIYVIKNTVKE